MLVDVPPIYPKVPIEHGRLIGVVTRLDVFDALTAD
jgi:hypothetical protein